MVYFGRDTIGPGAIRVQGGPDTAVSNSQAIIWFSLLQHFGPIFTQGHTLSEEIEKQTNVFFLLREGATSQGE